MIMTSSVSSKNKGKQAKKIVLQNRDQTEKKKKTVQQGNRKQRPRESNPVNLQVQATP